MSRKVHFFAMSDLHVSVKMDKHSKMQLSGKKRARIRKAFEKAKDGSFILIAGDLTESGKNEEYNALEHVIEEKVSLPILTVMGNHDSMGINKNNIYKNNGNFPYLDFQKRCMDRNKELGITVTEQLEDGSYAVQIDDVHILAPHIEKKKDQFIVSKDQQIAWMKQYIKRQRMLNSNCVFLFLCHPPLVGRSPLKGKRRPYINREEELCQLIDEIGNCIWISGHTHISTLIPEGEPIYDKEHGNLFINAGSVCINDLLDSEGVDHNYKDGNILEVEMTEKEIIITIHMLHNNVKTFIYERGT